MPQQIETPKQGWQRKWLTLSKGARLFIKSFLSRNIWKSETPTKMRGSRVAVLSDVNIHNSDPQEISQLNHQGMYWWDTAQIDALSSEHIRALSEAQIEALICNPNTTGDQIASFVKALTHHSYAPKLAILLRGLTNDPLEMSKLSVIADVVLHEVSRQETKRALIVICRSATNRQFRALLHCIPFHVLKAITEQELDNPHQEELNQLDLRVEEAQTQNSAELLTLAKGIEKVESAFTDALIDNKLTVDAKSTPWNLVNPRKLSELVALLELGEETERSSEHINRVLNSILDELVQRQEHLHLLNHRFSQLPELWEEQNLKVYTDHLALLRSVVTPQYTVLEQMSKMIIRKSGEKLTKDEHKVLLETFEKGCMLADLISPHVSRASYYLSSLRVEEAFIQTNRDTFFDNIRHETRVGRFCIEFFWRMIELGYEDKEAYPLLHGELFEDLIVKHPGFDQASRMLQSLYHYQEELERLNFALEQHLEKLGVEELGDKLREKRLELLNRNSDS